MREAWSKRLVASGLTSPEAEARAALFVRADTALGAIGPAGDRACAFFVPGRLEVLGKHTDYAGGRSLLCAVTRGLSVVARPRTDPYIRVVDGWTRELVDCALDGDPGPGGARWRTYPQTVARRLARNFPEARCGVDLAFASDLPSAAGMSSSSALMIGVFLALSDANALARTDRYRAAIANREDLAAYLATIENGRSFGPLAGDRGVGTFGGSEDQTAILCCRAGTLSQFAFAPTRLERELSLPGEWSFLVAVSGVVAAKTGRARDAYNRASLAAARALDIWRTGTGRADASLASAVASSDVARSRFRQLLETSADPEFTPRLLVDRFDQFCLETFDTIPAAGDAIAAGDLERFGRLVDRSQEAARELLGNQVPETVFLAASARELGAAAASAFGAGFGGSVWALVRAREAPAFCAVWRERYARAFPGAGARARVFETRPGPAAFRVETE